KCNTLGAVLGLFFHSKNVPEKVIYALHHLGVCDSQKSILNAISSMSKEAQVCIRNEGRKLLYGKFKSQLGQPPPGLCIPMKKTSHIPMRALNINQSTVEGNAEIIADLLKQMGIGPFGRRGEEEEEVSLDGLVSLFHGDLGTWEWVTSIIESRHVEGTEETQLQFLVFVMGLFHLRMAAAEALWRIYIKEMSGRTDSQSVFAYIGVVRPKETGKFGSNPGYRRLHEVIHDISHAAFMDCWRLEAMHQNPSHSDLEAFAASEPTWELLQKMARKIVYMFVAGATFWRQREQKTSERDIQFENSKLRNRDFLQYIELCHAMDHGDVGRVEDLFIPLICLFKSTGKHKYASAMVQMRGNLLFVYPEGLSHAIRMNWLVNPTGHPAGFCAVDWVVELNNLYTKVVYGGRFSNRTLQLMLKQSPLIEIFRRVHHLVDDWLHITKRSKKHAPSDMKNTLKSLCNYMAEGKAHVFIKG
ncbi:hypothetical protein M422DRAFT_181128, partial [Sphaerobolus stellatus SS14]